MTNYPIDSTKIDVLLGDREIVFKTHNLSNNNLIKFAINRVRSWRLTTAFKGTSHSDSIQAPNSKSRFICSSYEFSFEYLLPCGKLKWINLKSDQLIVIANCLHKIVRELLRKHKIEKNDQGRKEIQFDFSKRVCNYWKKSSTNRIDDQLQLTKSHSIDTFYVRFFIFFFKNTYFFVNLIKTFLILFFQQRPKTLLAETSFSSENKLFCEPVREDQSHI